MAIKLRNSGAARLPSLCLLIAAGAVCQPDPLFAADTNGPRVVKTQPTLHDDQVDPGTTEVVIEFDADMNLEASNLVQAMPGTVPDFPHIEKKSDLWRTPRTLVLPVTLQAGREYAIALNTVARSTVTSADGRPVAPYVLAFRTKGAARDSAFVTPDRNRESVDRLRTIIDKNYSHRDFQPVDWPARFDAFADRLSVCRTGDEFGLLTTALLAPAKDGHLWVRRYDRFWPTYDHKFAPNYNHETIRNVVPGWTKRNALMESGEFEDGVKYLAVTNLYGASVPDVLNSFRIGWDLIGEHPLILDLRMNGGGSDAIASVIAACFITEPRVFARIKLRDSTQPSGFTTTVSRVLKPALLSPRHTGKVAVLMGPGNVSSAESFICMMHQVDNARSFGQPSRGSTGNPKSYTLPNGVEVYAPRWVMMDPRGNVVQGRGLQPDVLIDTTPDDFAESDPVIEAALRWLRE